MKVYKEYPLHIPALNWALQLALLALGMFILNQLNFYLGIAYFTAWFGFIFIMLATRCRYCTYYGKICGGFQGKIVKYFFRKVSVKEFEKKDLKKLFVMQIICNLVPVVVAIYLLITNLTFLMLGILILYLLLMTLGNAIIHERFVCAHCERYAKKLCPIIEMFEKKKE